MPSLKNPPTKGTYTLVIRLEKETRIKVQQWGSFILQKGCYAYTGSALGDGAVGLRYRVLRHLKKRKTKHWHIDFLLASKNANIAAVVAAESSVNRECQANDAIKSIQGATIPVVGFGASDCKQNCGSHLVYFGEENAAEKVADKYRQLFAEDATLIPLKGGTEIAVNH